MTTAYFFNSSLCDALGATGIGLGPVARAYVEGILFWTVWQEELRYVLVNHINNNNVYFTYTGNGMVVAYIPETQSQTSRSTLLASR